MYDEVLDQDCIDNQDHASLSPITNDAEENDGEEDDDDEGFMFEPTVQITEVGEELDTTAEAEEDLGGGDGGDDGARENNQYDGENHDFSELIAKFNNNGDTEIQCDLCTYVTSRI